MATFIHESDWRLRLGFAVTTLLFVSTWSLSHGYQGIFHDAHLYALQALARIHPESLSNDVFLKFGSQDQFSIFSPIYAAASRVIGFENAAAALTLLFQLAFIAGAWSLARTFATPAFSLLGLCVLIAIPGTYGADRIFTCMETFLTPRMAAEAFALAGLAAALSSRRWLSVACMSASALLHPIMAAAGIMCIFCMYVAIPRPRWAIASAMLTLLACGGLALASGMSGTRWARFDPTWLQMIEARSPYLFVTYWRSDDWAPLVVTLATLIVGTMALGSTQSRKLALAVLTTVAIGFGFTLVACDWLHLIVATQVQAWRWQWIGTVVAGLLLPQILRALWWKQIPGRVSALLLIAAWVFAANIYAMWVALAAPGALLFLTRLRQREARHFIWGSCVLLALACMWRIGSNLEFTDAHYLDLHTPLWIRRATSFARDGSAPLALVGLTWYLAYQRRLAFTLVAIGAGGVAFGTLLIPQAWNLWTASDYSPRTIAVFAPMREKIPAGANVFWPEAPVSAWALLNAPSYLSVAQTSGMIFSRMSALEINRRAAALDASISPSSFMNWNNLADNINLSPQQLAEVCATGEFEFLVTHTNLGRQSVVDLPLGTPARILHLYRCAHTSQVDARQTRAAAAST